MMPCVGAHSLFRVQPIHVVLCGHTERPVRTHMKKHSTMREHRKVSASVVLTDQMSSLLFSSSAPCTCSLTQYDPRGDEGTGRLKSLESTLLLALSGTSSGGTNIDVFFVMLTQDNLMSDAAGDHLTVQVDGY